MKALRHILAGMAGIGAMVAFAGSASADLILLLDDDANATFEVVVIDNQASGVTDGSYTSNTADASATDGAILYAGSVGTWSVVLSFGTSQPVLPSGEMDLTVSATSAGADTLSIWLIDTDFLTGGSTAFIEWALDAAAGSTSTACGGVSGSNSDATFFPFACIGPVGDGFYTDSFAAALAAGVPFSMALNWIITHTVAGQTTGDLRITVPEPMTAALFGMGLLGIGAVRRRKKKAA